MEKKEKKKYIIENEKVKEIKFCIKKKKKKN